MQTVELHTILDKTLLHILIKGYSQSSVNDNINDIREVKMASIEVVRDIRSGSVTSSQSLYILYNAAILK